jgi:hypothetical protein
MKSIQHEKNQRSLECALVMAMQTFPGVEFPTLEDSFTPIKHAPIVKGTKGG